MDELLREWRVDAPLPPRFQEQVWRRIERAAARPESPPRTLLSRLLGGALPCPGFAFACLAVFLALGMAAGAWAAQRKTSRLDSELGLRYVQSIDPYRAGNSAP
jgi:hypothetical protein